MAQQTDAIDREKLRKQLKENIQRELKKVHWIIQEIWSYFPNISEITNNPDEDMQRLARTLEELVFVIGDLEKKYEPEELLRNYEKSREKFIEQSKLLDIGDFIKKPQWGVLRPLKQTPVEVKLEPGIYAGRWEGKIGQALEPIKEETQQPEECGRCRNGMVCHHQKGK